MKLQGLSIIFTLICIPLLLVLSYYLSLQVDTIRLQNQYDTKLLDATYDALSAFELNTANEDLSTVSDSLRTIIDASNSIFFNTLATNMGLSNASKSYVEPYIPAILYTLYDGYYIYSPTTVPEVATSSNGTAIKVGDDGVTTVANSDVYSYVCSFDEDNPPEPFGSNAGSYYIANNGNKKEDYGQILFLTNNSKKTDDGSLLTYDNLTTDVNDAKKTVKSVLKSYMPYSARYTGIDGNTKYDFTIIYTLDNYLTVEGYKIFNSNTANPKKVYYTESGYLINNGSIDISPLNIRSLNQNTAKEMIENREITNLKINIFNDNNGNNALDSGEKDVVLDIEELSYCNDLIGRFVPIYGTKLTELTVDNDEDWRKKTEIQKYESLMNILKNKATEYEENPDFGIESSEYKNINTCINELQYNMDLMSSLVYYTKASIFTNWVNSNLNMIKENDITEISGIKYSTLQGTNQTVGEDTSKYTNSKFLSVDALKDRNSSNGVTEIDTDSIFYSHKLDVIRDSVQYNLNLAMSTYNNNEAYHLFYDDTKGTTTNSGFNYAMPVLQEYEWNSILSNPSIVSFMQGMKCGLKIYNNYMVVSSTNNELVTHPEDINYVAYNAGDFSNYNDTESVYHKIDCKELIPQPPLEPDNPDSIKKFQSFSSKEVKYDKLYNKLASGGKNYKYDHKNLACYECINDGNYGEDKEDGGNGINDYMEKIFNPEFPQDNPNDYNNYINLRKAYYLAVGKERNNIYKMNAFDDSYGYEIYYDSNKSSSFNSGKDSILDLNQIRQIEVTFNRQIGQGNSGSLTYLPKYDSNANDFYDKSYSIPAGNATEYTWIMDFKSTAAVGTKFQANKMRFDGVDGAPNINGSIKMIKIIYK